MLHLGCLGPVKIGTIATQALVVAVLLQTATCSGRGGRRASAEMTAMPMQLCMPLHCTLTMATQTEHGIIKSIC